MRRRRVLRVGLWVLALGLALALTGEILVRALGLATVRGEPITCWDAVYGKRVRSDLDGVRTTPRYRMRLSTNAAGRRGPLPRDGVPIVVVLGDDVSFGMGVDDGQEYPRLLEATLRTRGHDLDVVSHAMPSDANGRALLRMRHALPARPPRAVVLQISGDDFRDNAREALFALDGARGVTPRAIPSRSLPRAVQDLLAPLPWLHESQLLAWLREGVAARDSGADAPAPRIAGGGVHPVDVDALTLALIDASLAECAQRGWPVLVVLANVDVPAQQDALRDLAAARGARLLVLPPRTLAPEHHLAGTELLTVAGHRDAATRIADALESPPSLLR